MRNNHTVIIASLIIILLLPDNGISQDCIDEYVPSAVEVGELDISFLGGVISEEGHLLFAIGHDILHVVDFSDPQNLTLISSTPVDLPFSTYDKISCAQTGNWLLIDAEYTGLIPVNILNPENPIIHPPLLAGEDHWGLTAYGGSFFTSAGSKGIIWFESSSLPEMTEFQAVTLNELTEGQVDQPAKGSFGSGLSGLFFLQEDGYFFKLYPNEWNNHGTLSCHFRLPLDHYNNFHQPSVILDEDQVWISFICGSQHYPEFMTFVLDANNIQNATTVFPGLHINAVLNNQQIISGNSIYEISGSERTFIRSLHGLQNVFIEAAETLLFCRASRPDDRFVCLDYSNFREPSQRDRNFLPSYSDIFFSGTHMNSAYAWYNTTTPEYPDNPPRTSSKIFRVLDDGSLSFQPGYGVASWITSRYLGGCIDYAAPFIMNLETMEIVWLLDEPQSFVTGDLYTDTVGCFVTDNLLVLNDLTVSPPTPISTWTAAETIRMPDQLFRGGYFIYAINPETGPEVIVLDIGNAAAPYVISRLEGLWSDSADIAEIQISGELLTVKNSNDTLEYFDISHPENPLHIPENPYPGLVKEDISLCFHGNHATVFHVPSLHENYLLGEIMIDYLDYEGSDPQWSIIGTTLVIEMYQGLATFMMPCASQVPTQLQFFELKNENHLAWEFNETVSSGDIRILVEQPHTWIELPFYQESDGSWAAEIPDELHYSQEGSIQFQLLIRQNDATWTVISTVSKSFLNTAPNLEIISISPNPCNPSTTISFHLLHSMGVEVAIYNLAGQRVRLLLNEVLAGQTHRINWNGKDDDGSPCSSGTYFMSVRSDLLVQSRKITLLK